MGKENFLVHKEWKNHSRDKLFSQLNNCLPFNILIYVIYHFSADLICNIGFAFLKSSKNVGYHSVLVKRWIIATVMIKSSELPTPAKITKLRNGSISGQSPGNT